MEILKIKFGNWNFGKLFKDQSFENWKFKKLNFWKLNIFIQNLLGTTVYILQIIMPSIQVWAGVNSHIKMHILKPSVKSLCQQRMWAQENIIRTHKCILTPLKPTSKINSTLH